MKFAALSLDLLEKYDVQGPRYTSYPPAPFWKTGMGPKDYEVLLSEGGKSSHPKPLSLYVHLPFCEHLCLFCACSSVITGSNHQYETPYLDALLEEVAWVAEQVGRERKVIQVHLGGGTPNYFSPRNLSRLVKALKAHFSFDADVEMGVELDPRTTSDEHLSTLRQLGFNRISMGIQDLDPDVQSRIRRIQPYALIKKIVNRARDIGFKGINFDLIYGLPGQTIDSFRRTVGATLELHPDRYAVYSYAYVPWMKKHQETISRDQPRGRQKFHLFLCALRDITSAGYEYIGMDHFGKPNDELSRARKEGTLWRNFQGYTTKAGTDLIGFGLSAISQVTDGYMQNNRQLFAYQKAVSTYGAATTRGIMLTPEDKLRSFVIQSIMCHAVLMQERVEEKFHVRFEQVFADALVKLVEMERDGLVSIKDKQIRTTDVGRVFLRNIAMAFDDYLPKPGDKTVFSRTV